MNMMSKGVKFDTCLRGGPSSPACGGIVRMTGACNMWGAARNQKPVAIRQ